jgi:hypothetical protein
LTTQVSNKVIYHKDSFDLVGYTDDGLINPEKFGVKLKPITSLCWRGYISSYQIDNENQFLLNSLTTFSEKKDKIIEIKGVKPDIQELTKDGKITQRVYNDLNIECFYDGKILLGKDFLTEYRKNMGFHPAWKYRTVYELEIKKGRLISYHDLSDKFSEIRSELKDKTNNGIRTNQGVNNDILTWIEKSFNQKYKK